MGATIVIMLILLYLYGGLCTIYEFGPQYIYDGRNNAEGSFYLLLLLIFWAPLLMTSFFVVVTQDFLKKGE